MDSAAIVTQIVERSGRSKSALSTASGVSRSLIDDYLKGRSQPSVAQLERLAEAADLSLSIGVHRKRRPLPETFVAVLEFGDLFPRKDPAPPVNLGPVWRRAS